MLFFMLSYIYVKAISFIHLANLSFVYLFITFLMTHPFKEYRNTQYDRREFNSNFIKLFTGIGARSCIKLDT